MLVIREAQFQFFSTALEAEFRQKLSRYLEEKCPRLSNSDLQEQISLGMARAKEYGLVREIDAARFIEAVCVHLGGFTGQPFPKPALAILYGYRTDPDAKLDRFVQWCQSVCTTGSPNAK